MFKLQSKMNVLQGQRIHTLLHPYSALSLIDNLSVLSEGRYSHAARTDPAIHDTESTGPCVQRVSDKSE